MRAPVITALVAGALGCSGPVPGGAVDAGDGGIDAGPLTSGLRIEFVTLPEVPGSWDHDLAPTLEGAELRLGDLRIVGDASSDRTRLEQLALAWGESPAMAAAEFADAPIGRYSRIRASFERLTMEGSFEPGDDDDADWEIEDEETRGDLDLEISVDLEPGEVAIIQLQVDLESLFEAVDWTQVNEDDEGGFVVDDDSDMIEAVRDALDDCITVVSAE